MSSAELELEQQPVDATDPELDPAVLRDQLLARLRVQREQALEHYAWYQAQQDPPALPPDYTGAPQFNRLRKMARGDWARVIVDTIAERLEIQGVRTSSGDAADEAAWTLLQENRIDADQRDVHVEALLTGRSYVSVDAAEEGSARIVPETCLELTHVPPPGDRRGVAAALKVFELAAGVWEAELYLPSRSVVWTAEYASSSSGRDPLAIRARAPWSDEPTVVPNGLGVVPVVPFENRPVAAIGAESELSGLVQVMERIQELELAKLMAAHTAIFRQKWATGTEVPRDPSTGKPVEPFQVALTRLWISDDPESRFGSFEATEVRQYLAAIDAEVAELAAISRVPTYYLVQTELANPPSAESLIASDAGLVAKVYDRQRSFGESWEQVTRLASAYAGADDTAGDRTLEILWKTPERRSPAVMADAATKLQAIGVPQEELWAFVGYSPQAIQRMRVQAAAESLAAELAAPAAPAPATP